MGGHDCKGGADQDDRRTNVAAHPQPADQDDQTQTGRIDEPGCLKGFAAQQGSKRDEEGVERRLPDQRTAPRMLQPVPVQKADGRRQVGDRIRVDRRAIGRRAQKQVRRPKHGNENDP